MRRSLLTAEWLVLTGCLAACSTTPLTNGAGGADQHGAGGGGGSVSSGTGGSVGIGGSISGGAGGSVGIGGSISGGAGGSVGTGGSISGGAGGSVGTGGSISGGGGGSFGACGSFGGAGGGGGRIGVGGSFGGGGGAGKIGFGGSLGSLGGNGVVGTGGSLVEGSGGNVGGGTGGSCPSGTGPNVISSFEDGFGSVLQQGVPPRNGGWNAYNDLSATCMESPPVGGPLPAATLNDPTVTGGACGSLYSFRFYGSGCPEFAGIQTDLNDPLPPVSGDGGLPDAGVAPDGGTGAVAQKIPYDLSGYKAVTFWGRTGPMAVPSNQTVHFKLPMLVDTQTTNGGLCVESATNLCSASYGKFLPFTAAWQQYTLNFGAFGMPGDLSQETWGTVFTWDPTNVVMIQFEAAASSTFDIWIDDITLVPR